MKRRVASLCLTLIMLSGCTGYYSTGGAWLYFEADIAPREAVPLTEYGTPTPESVIAPTPTPEPICVIVSSYPAINLRTNPGGPVIGNVATGSEVVIVERDGEWVRIENPAGWVAGWLVECG